MPLWRDVTRTGRDLISDPRRTFHQSRRALGLLWAAWALKSCEVGPRVTVMGPVVVENLGRVEIGHHTYFLPGMLPTRIKVHPGAELHIGAYAGFNFGALLEATKLTRIGERCMFASMVSVRDAFIGDDVWVAYGASIEPGVTIGEGSVISAGTTVTRDVPPYHLAIGSPARNVRLATLSRGR